MGFVFVCVTRESENQTILLQHDDVKALSSSSSSSLSSFTSAGGEQTAKSPIITQDVGRPDSDNIVVTHFDE